jgi:hypothetical protein
VFFASALHCCDFSSAYNGLVYATGQKKHVFIRQTTLRAAVFAPLLCIQATHSVHTMERYVILNGSTQKSLSYEPPLTFQAPLL